MSRTRKIPLAFGLAAILAIVFWQRTELAGEGPEYGGKRLSIWFAKYSSAVIRCDSKTETECVQAFRGLGVNAIKFMVDTSCSVETNGVLTRLKLQALRELPPRPLPDSLSSLRDRIFNLNAVTPISEDFIRNCTLRALAAIQPPTNEVVPLLESKLADNQPSVRRHAIVLLGAVRPFQAAEPLLVQAVDDPEKENQREAIRVFARSKQPSKQFASALSLAFQKADFPGQQRMVNTLLDENSEEAAAIPLLVRLIHNPASTNRLQLAMRIWRIDRDHPEVMAAMEQEIRGFGPRFFNAVEILASSAHPPVLPPEFFNSPEFASTLRRAPNPYFNTLLMRLGFSGSTAISRTEAALAVAPLWEREAIASQLWNLEPGSKAALKAILEVITSPVSLRPSTPGYRMQDLALLSLRDWGPLAAPAVPTLREMLTNGAPHLTHLVETAIDNIQATATADPKPDSAKK